MTKCMHCGKTYHPGNWKWSAWLCNPCVKSGVTPK